ncbi:hypothetical protein E2C01_041280 [Portunus trituberculatus]|uniref:Uncharacterized protein n=1 Tax=Portunus trituberculatus TaxID=210409 RepID=A0A5B7FIT8_PORTR|nr:hypothetical protein [Portunus trituberculatus]
MLRPATQPGCVSSLFLLWGPGSPSNGVLFGHNSTSTAYRAYARCPTESVILVNGHTAPAQLATSLAGSSELSRVLLSPAASLARRRSFNMAGQSISFSFITGVEPTSRRL